MKGKEFLGRPPASCFNLNMPISVTLSFFFGKMGIIVSAMQLCCEIKRHDIYKVPKGVWSYCRAIFY